MKKSKNYIIFSVFIFFIFGLLSIENDLPNYLSNSRAPWIDEALKNYISKNIVEFQIAKPYPENEFRASWIKVPVYTIWTLPFLKLFGVGYIQIRILSLITTILALSLFYKFLSKGIKKRKDISLLFIVLLTNPTFFFFSRMGTYESLFFLITSIIIFFTLFNTQNKFYILLAGIFCSILYWLKPIGILIFFTSLIFLLFVDKREGKKVFDFSKSKSVMFSICFILIQFLIYIYLKLAISDIPRAMTLSGTKEIFQGKVAYGFYPILWNILSTFESTNFFQLNILIVFLSLFGLSMYLLSKTHYNKPIDYLNLIMALWFIISVLGLSWSTYKPARLYYFMIPSMIYWSTYILRISREKLGNKNKISIFISFFILSCSFSMIISYLFQYIDHFFVTNGIIYRVGFSPLKIIGIFIIILFFSKSVENLILTKFSILQFISKILIVITCFYNAFELQNWYNLSNKSLVDYNDRIEQLMRNNKVNKIAGQWSPSFTFNLKKVESYPILPGIYNDNVIKRLKIKYLLLERDEINEMIENDIITIKDSINLIESFNIANKWEIDLFKIK